MIPIPKMSFVMPLRNRTTFTANALPTFLLHAVRDHEVILILDKCPLTHEFRRRPDSFTPSMWEQYIKEDQDAREHMYRWLDSHQALLDEYHVRVLEFQGDERFWTGGMRMSGALNIGVGAATTDWIVGVGDEDLIFMPEWDRVMWETLGLHQGRDPNKTVSNMVMVTLQGRETWDGDRGPGAGRKIPTAAWIHAQRAACAHYLTFPVALKHQDPRSTRISYAALSEFIDAAKLPGVVEEQCGVRLKTHWVPELMYKPMLVAQGMWPTDDASAFGPDIVQDDRFHHAGIQRRMASDHMIVHSKHYLYKDTDWDRVWVDPKIVDSIPDIL
jgi:hypothetical protein